MYASSNAEATAERAGVLHGIGFLAAIQGECGEALAALEEAEELLTFPGLFGTARLIAGKAHGLNLLVLDAPYLYGRPGNPYTAPDGTEWPDNAYRFGALGKVAAEIGLSGLVGRAGLHAPPAAAHERPEAARAG